MYKRNNPVVRRAQLGIILSSFSLLTLGKTNRPGLPGLRLEPQEQLGQGDLEPLRDQIQIEDRDIPLASRHVR